jgi:hypothetical protein
MKMHLLNNHTSASWAERTYRHPKLCEVSTFVFDKSPSVIHVGAPWYGDYWCGGPSDVPTIARSIRATKPKRNGGAR